MLTTVECKEKYVLELPRLDLWIPCWSHPCLLGKQSFCVRSLRHKDHVLACLIVNRRFTFQSFLSLDVRPDTRHVNNVILVSSAQPSHWLSTTEGISSVQCGRTQPHAACHGLTLTVVQRRTHTAQSHSIQSN